MRHLAGATLLIGRAHFVRMLFGKRILFCALLLHLPVLAAFFLARVNSRVSPAELAAELGWLMLLQITLPLAALLGGSAVVAEELEDRTITYLFTRPFPRPALLFGRFAATVTLLLLLTASAVYLLLLASERARGRGDAIDAHFARSLFEAAFWGVAVYSALFAALGTFFKHPMIIGVAYAFAVEGFLSNLPGKNQALTVQYYMRSLIAEDAAAAWRRVEGFDSTTFATSDRALTILAVLVVLCVGLGAWRLSRRQFELTA
jgi:ABC-type transport system involved in multi-copper enzyme maturation permease subunit